VTTDKETRRPEEESLRQIQPLRACGEGAKQVSVARAMPPSADSD